MAKSKPPKSALSNLLPLFILFIVIVVVVVVGLVVYGIATEIADKTSKKMEKHNVSFTKDGMKVGVKGKTAEQLEDDTQGVLMKVWNSSSWPAYKSKLGWGQGTGAATGAQVQEKRQSYARTNSGKTS